MHHPHSMWDSTVYSLTDTTLHHTLSLIFGVINVFVCLIDIESITSQENVSSKLDTIITWEEVFGEETYAQVQ